MLRCSKKAPAASRLVKEMKKSWRSTATRKAGKESTGLARRERGAGVENVAAEDCHTGGCVDKRPPCKSGSLHGHKGEAARPPAINTSISGL